MNEDTHNAWLWRILRALVLCPHTDDELGCAGLILRLLQAGAEIKYIALSRCEASVPDPYPKDILEVECRLSTSRLGIPPNQVEILDYPVRYFPEHRQDILERFIQLKCNYRPDLVLAPSSFDNHQDHATVYSEAVRLKNSTILGYELPQNLISFSNSAFVKLTEELLQQKLYALSSYTSQTFRAYTSSDFIRSLNLVRGVQCNAPYAEAYEVIRLII